MSNILSSLKNNPSDLEFINPKLQTFLDWLEEKLKIGEFVLMPTLPPVE